MLPVVHTLRHCWPETRLTWIIGGAEAILPEGLEGVEFVTFRKHLGWRAYRQLAARPSVRIFRLWNQPRDAFCIRAVDDRPGRLRVRNA